MEPKSIPTNDPESHNIPAAGRRSTSRRDQKKLLSGNNERNQEEKEETIMARNQSNTTQGTRSDPPFKKPCNDSAKHQHNHTFDATIDELYNHSRSGLRGLLLFLIASAIALYCKEYRLADVLSANSMKSYNS